MFKKSLVVCSLFAVAGVASAAPTASSDVTISGSVTPSSCALVMSGNAVDYGHMTTEEVKKMPTYADEVYVLPGKTVNVVATCASPTRFAFGIVDNRTGSSTDARTFGMGNYTPPGGGTPEKIGMYYLTYRGHTSVKATEQSASAAPAKYLETMGEPTADSVWTSGGDVFYTTKSAGFAADAASTSPDPLVEAKMDLFVQSHLMKALIGTATTEIVMDGSVTITMTVF